MADDDEIGVYLCAQARYFLGHLPRGGVWLGRKARLRAAPDRQRGGPRKDT